MGLVLAGVICTGEQGLQLGRTLGILGLYRDVRTFCTYVVEFEIKSRHECYATYFSFVCLSTYINADVVKLWLIPTHDITCRFSVSEHSR